ncbi:hypothetical protein GBAR_LOCUS26174 [Geodia barretti]|uniref:Death domain-containing protein n=1 Tax=Geodia barretti TaxID=519541 RepID=A0AA35XE20_GEOBA|nr:hypothetical protein GBAR_LOCUS26174 [Geodia barretti]
MRLQIPEKVGVNTGPEKKTKPRRQKKATAAPPISNPTAAILREAMKDGYIPHKDDLFLIHGPGGVGKSSLISMFLGKQRDLARVSTAVAEESLHLCPVRDVSTSTFTGQWELVDIDRQARMVAHTSRHLLTSEGVQRIEEYKDKPSESAENEGQVEAFLASPPELQQTPPKKGEFAKIASKLFAGLRKLVRRSHQAATPEAEPPLGDDPDNIEGLFARFNKGLLDIIRDPHDLAELLLYYSIRLLDSGGQPQFHEVASIVLPAVTGIISVFKLSEPLAVHGEVVLYKDGVQANDPYESYLTNEQVIRHDLLAIQSDVSQKGTEEMPNLAFVGTFLDQQDACPEETPDQKDERLHSMITEILSKDMQQCVISSGSLRHVAFRVNTRTPTEKDYETTGQLKDALMSQSRVKPRNLPLKWCGFEVALRKMMEQLNRQILSVQECEFIGSKLGFDPLSLKACLNYLRQLHILSFYDVLPKVVFGSCQVILDKITELIVYSLQLKKGDRFSTGVDRKFHQQGILSLDILQSKACSKHYSSKYFVPEDLPKVLKSLFIVTEVGPGEYLMPCVLEVSDILPSPPVPKGNVRSSFVLHFSKKSPMLGIYCCTISYLLTAAGWKLLARHGEVVQVARNSITFELPQNLPGKLTFLDPLSSYLEVAVDLPAAVAAQHSTMLYKEIGGTFVKAMKSAMQTLHYEVRTPELSFLCPEQSSLCSDFPHLATLNTTHSLLTCSRSPHCVAHPLTPDQKMWLPTPAEGPEKKTKPRRQKKATAAPPISISAEKPDLLQLLKIDLPSRVAPKINAFGTFLLQDSLGNKMEIIRGNHQGRLEEMAMEVLREWLAGKGVEVSWESLIATLRESKDSFMADQIQIALDNLRS